MSREANKNTEKKNFQAAQSTGNTSHLAVIG